VAITLITPHQRPNSGGVYAIEQFARHAAALTEVHLIVAKGKPVPIEGVRMHGPDTLRRLRLPESDALLIPADMRTADQLFGLPPDRGAPMLLFQGYGTPSDAVVQANLVVARHAVCTASWLVDEALRAGCTASLIRYGLDRAVFTPGPPAERRRPIVAMMTHPMDWKGTADGLAALKLAKARVEEIEFRLFGKLDPAKLDPDFKTISFLPAPNALTDVATLMREAAVLACPSWEEGFGLPGIEAITSGAALATTDTKGSRDYAFDDRTALVSAPRDPEALASNIAQLIRDPGLRQRLVNAGQRQIEATYPEWPRAAEAFVAAVHTAAEATREARDLHRAPRDAGEGAESTVAEDDGVLEAEAAAARLARDSRRTKLLLREAEVERHELEAELGRRSREATDARKRARELQAELERERETREQAEAARSAADGRANRLVMQLAQNEEWVSELEATNERSSRELDSARRELAILTAELEDQQRQLGAARALNASLDQQLAETRNSLNRAQSAEADARGQLAELSTELELAGAQRQRLMAALARSRADAQVAEAERAAYQRQLAEVSGSIDPGWEQGPYQPSGEPPSQASDANGGPGSAAPATIADLRLLPSAARTWSPLPAVEREAQTTFVSQYEELAAFVAPLRDGRDPLAVALPSDPRGMLAVAGAPQEVGRPTVDVVVCVHDAFEDLRLCLWSLVGRATRRFRLIIVNDGSDEVTSAFLRRVAAELPAISLIERDSPPHGYTLAANAGMRVSTSGYVVLLNSDTIVPHSWLERIVDHGERHPSIGILGPLSNAATHQSVPDRRSEGEWATNPLPNWLTEDGMALILERLNPQTNTQLPFINGFCYVVKRSVIDAIGLFDEERFPAGYAEENDFSQRAREAGFRLGVVDDAYVYHAKSRSYGSRYKDTARQGYQLFLDKHGKDKIDALVTEMEESTTLDPIRSALRDATASPAATERELADLGGGGISIAFVLPGLSDGGSGGSHSVYQEMHGLRRIGVPARILLAAPAWERAVGAYDDAAEAFEKFEDEQDLAARTADATVIVATHFKSVAIVAALAAERDDFLPAYYIQDYEPMFKFAQASDTAEAAASYTAIPGALLFAKTHWLCNVVSRRHGVFVAKVEPSIDSSVYRPSRSASNGGPVRIAAMLRPRTPRRQPFATASVLERLLEERPGEVEIRSFGCRSADLETITDSAAIGSAHAGLLKRAQVAELLGESDVFLDMSTYQAFGRTALEAMACGCTAVVPALGGAWEFVEDGSNALAVDTFDRDAALRALTSLVDDRDRLAELQAGARDTGARFSILRAAISEYAVLLNAYRSRFG
jgi:GT2 family glycosyltransferase/glycosyltransferase involved in cell wall biosynthesis